MRSQTSIESNRDNQFSSGQRRRRTAIAVAVFAGAVSLLGHMPVAEAQSTYQWTMVPPQAFRNWNEGWNLSNGAVLPYPAEAGAVVTFIHDNNDPPNTSDAGLTVNVTDAMLGSLTMGRFSSAGNLRLLGTNALTFSDPSGIARFATPLAGIGTVTLVAPVVLDPAITQFRIRSNGTGSLSFGTITANNAAALLNIEHLNAAPTNGPGANNLDNPVGFATIRVGNTVPWQSLGTLAPTGATTINNNAVGGAINVSAAGLIVRDRFTGNAAITLNNIGANSTLHVVGSGGYSGSVTVNNGSLVLNHNGGFTGANAAIKTNNASVTLNAATLGMTGGGSVVTSNVLSGVTLAAGANTLNLTHNGQNILLTGGTLTRTAGSTLVFTRNNNSTTASFTGLTTTNNIIGGWATTSNSALNSGQFDFLSVTAAGILTPIAAYAAWTSPGTGVENVSANSNQTIASNTTINSLRVTGNMTITANANLTLNSGGLLLAGANFASSTLTINGSGVLSSASGELFLHIAPPPNAGAQTAILNNPVNIAGGSLIKTGPGLLTVANLQATTGSKVLLQGGSYRGAVPSTTNFLLTNGAVIDTNNTASPAYTIGTGDGQIQFGQGGGGFSASGQPASVTVNGGGTLTAAQLGRNLSLQGFAANAPIVLNNDIDVTGDMAITVGANAATSLGSATARINGVISGAGGLTINGSSANGLLIVNTPSTFTGGVLINNGAIWAVNGEGIPAAAPILLTNTGVWASRGLVDRRLGGSVDLADGGIRWQNETTNPGSFGGFAAVGGPLTVSLKNRDGNLATLNPTGGNLTLGSPGGLVLGSGFSTSPVTVTNNILLTGASMQIRSVGPAANVLAGNISGTNSAIFAGPGGVLVVTGDNSAHTGRLEFQNSNGVVLRFANANAAVGGKSAASNVLSVNNDTTFDPNGVDLLTATPGTFRNISFSNGSGQAGLGMLINSNRTTAVNIGDANISAGTNLNFGGPGDTRVNGNVLGGNQLVKRGYGRLILAGGNTQTTQGMLLGGGSTVFDYSTNTTSKFNGAVVTSTNNASGNLQLVATGLVLNGHASTPVTQAVLGLQLGQSSGQGNAIAQSGPATVNLVGNGANLTLAIDRLVRIDNQGSINFATTNTGSGTSTITINNIPSNGVVSAINLVNGGTGYTTAPTVEFRLGTTLLTDGTSTPQATAIVSGGSVTGFVITKSGSGTISAGIDPATFANYTVTFTGGGGTGASATPVLSSLPNIGGFATWNKTDFAALSSGTVGAVGSYTSIATYLNADSGTTTTGDPLANLDIPAGSQTITLSALSNIVTANSLRFNDGSADTDLTIAAGNLRLNSQAGGLLVTPNVGTRNVNINGNLRWNFNRDLFVYNYSQGTVTFNGQVSDASAGVGFSKLGEGDVVLNGTANVANLRVYGGRLIATSLAAMSAASNPTIIIGGQTPENSGVDVNGKPKSPTFRFIGAGGNFGGSISLIGPGILDASGTGTFAFTSGGNNVTSNQDAPWDFTVAGTQDVTFAGPVRLGSSTLTLDGYGQYIQTNSGVVTLNGSTNRALGGWVLNAGTLALGHATDTIQNNNIVTVNTGATVTLATSDRFAALRVNGGTVAGAGTYSAGSYEVTAGSASASLGGVISDLTKTGPGTFTLSATNTYGGFTPVTGGTLAVTSTGTINSPRGVTAASGTSIVVDGSVVGPVVGSTATFTGSGTVGALSLDAGALSPATIGTAGTLTVVGSTLLGGGGTFTLDIASIVLADQINSGGSLSISSYNLVIADPTNVAASSWTIANATAGVTGTFTATLPLGFSLVYNPTSVVLTKAPVVNEWALTSGGDWNTPANWTAGTVPNAIGADALLAGNLAASGAVSLSAPVTVGKLTFNNALASYTVSDSTLTFQGTSTSDIVVTAGSHSISSAVVLTQLTTAAVNGTNLTVSGDITGAGSLTKTGPGTLVLSGGINYAGNTAVNAGTLRVSGNAVLVKPASTLSVEGSALLVVETLPAISGTPIKVLDVAALVLNGSPGNTSDAVILQYGPGDSRAASLQNAVKLGSLTIANDAAPLGSRAYYGTLDLGDNDMVVSSGLADLRDMVRAWYNAGLRDGEGLATTAATNTGGILATDFVTLAVRSNDIGNGFADFATFAGIPVIGTDILVKYTYFGDTNLDGLVDASDFNAVLNGFTNGLTGWENGDSNYDGVVNGTDFSLMLSALTGQGSPLAGGGNTPVGAIPEPASLALLAAPLALLTRRRRA
jgi:fibronectin-binding autotransporter adhesin